VAVPLLPSSWRSCPIREPDPVAAPSAAAAHEVGARVRIMGLSNATQLNGSRGVVTRVSGEGGVVYVQLDAQTENDDRTSPPLKLLAKFVEPGACASDADEDVVGAVSRGLPACVLHEPGLAGEDDAAAERRTQMHMEALHAAQHALQTASDCVLGKPFASSWALDGCDASNVGTWSTGTSSSGRGQTFQQENLRRTWCKTDMDIEMDIENNGAKIQGVDEAVRVLAEHGQVLQVLKDSPNRVEDALAGAARALLAVAGALQRAGRLEEALEVASGVLPIARRISGGLVEAKASLIMGRSKCRAGRFVEARHHARQAGLLSLHCHDQCGQIDAAVVLGQCNHGLYRYTEATRSFLFALHGARQMADRMRQVDILAKLSQVLAEMGHTHSAIEHAQQAVALSEEEGQLASANVAIAAVFARAGDHEQASSKAQEHLDLCVRSSSYEHNKLRVDALGIKGWALLALKHPTEGEDTFLQQQKAAVWLGDVAGEASALQGLSAALVALRQYELALDILRQEEVLWDCMGDFMRRRMCLDRICKMLEKLKHRNEAMVIRRREGVSVHPLAPLFSNEDYNQLHFDEDHFINNPRLRHNERPHPWLVEAASRLALLSTCCILYLIVTFLVLLSQDAACTTLPVPNLGQPIPSIEFSGAPCDSQLSCWYGRPHFVLLIFSFCLPATRAGPWIQLIRILFDQGISKKTLSPSERSNPNPCRRHRGQERH